MVNELIKAQREKKGLSQRDLAKLCGVSQQNLSRIEQGKHAISYEYLKKIVEALGGEIVIKFNE